MKERPCGVFKSKVVSIQQAIEETYSSLHKGKYLVLKIKSNIWTRQLSSKIHKVVSPLEEEGNPPVVFTPSNMHNISA